MLSLSELIGFGGTGVTGGAPTATAFFAWGDNSEGQGGDGGVVDPLLVPTNTDTASNIFIPSASFNYALHMGYLIGDELSMAGDGQYGQLGLGDDTDRSSFTDVVSNGSNITDFALGQYHSLTVRNGKVNGCGRNNQDQITSAEPSQTNIFSIIVNVGDMEGADAVKVYASQLSSAVLSSGNRVFTWGRRIGSLGGSGSIGEPINITEFNSSFINLEGKDISAFAMGSYHALALTSEGEVYSMADSNSYGQAGNGDVSSNSQFTQRVFESTQVTKISCGITNSYLIENGKLFGCGRGDGGQLAGASTASENPFFIELDSSITNWIDVQGGDGYVIAKRQDGSLYHSGDKSFAQDGNGTAAGTNLVFVQIVGPPNHIYGNFVTARRTVYGLV